MRQAVDDYIKVAGKKPGEFLFTGRGDNNRCITTPQYAGLVSSWVERLASTLTFSPRTRCDAPKQRSSTVEPGTYVPCSCCSVTRHTAREHRQKPRSTTLTIRNSVRLSSSEGVSSRTTSKWQSSCSPTARLPACQRGCSPNRLHNTEYADPQRFQLHFCSLCVSKSMRS